MTEPTIIDPTSFLTGNPEDHIKEPDKKEIQHKKEEVVKDPPAKILKQRMEKAEKELEELKKKYADADRFAPLAPIADYLKEKEGDINEETVKKFIEKGKNRKKELSEISERLKNKDIELKNIKIEASDEWREEFQKPINESSKNLFALLANFDNEGKIKNEELITSLYHDITSIDKEGKPKDAVAIRASIKRFQDIYSKKTGEDYEIPSINEVMNGVRTIHNNIIKAHKARQDWEATIEERKKERLFEEDKKKQSWLKKELDGRNFIKRQVLSDFDYSELENIASKEEIEEAINNEHSFLNAHLTNSEDKKPRSYNEYLINSVKATLYDKLLEKNKELMEEIKILKEDSKSGLSHQGVRKSQNGTTIKVDNSSPTAFLD